MKKYLLLFLALLLIGMPCCCHGQILRQADPVTGERNIVSMNNTGNRSVKKAFRKQLNPDGARYYNEKDYYLNADLSDFEQLQVLWNEAEFAEVQQAAVAEW